MYPKTFNLEAADGLNLQGRLWMPDSDTSGVICIVHGLGEHSGRYADFAESLTEQGYAVLATFAGTAGPEAGEGTSLAMKH